MNKDKLHERLKDELSSLAAKAESIALELGIDYDFDDILDVAETYIDKLFKKVFSKRAINKYSRKFRAWWRGLF